jgi:hypothetical protein
MLLLQLVAAYDMVIAPYIIGDSRGVDLGKDPIYNNETKCQPVCLNKEGDTCHRIFKKGAQYKHMKICV